MSSSLSLKSLIDAVLKNSKESLNDAKNIILDAYNQEMGSNLESAHITRNEEKQIQQWLNLKTDLTNMSGTLESTLIRTHFLNDSDRLRYIQQSQSQCKICNTETTRFFSIRIPPKSYQSTEPKLRKYYKNEIAKHPFVKNRSRLNSSMSLCIQLICVLNSSRDKDVDNMAKLILDGLKGNLFTDDKNITHLQVIKFRSLTSEEHIRVGIADSALSEKRSLFTDNNSSFGANPKISF